MPARDRSRIAAIVVLAGVAACGDGGTSARPPVPTPNGDGGPPPLRCAGLSAAPSALSLGAIPPDRWLARSIELRNPGPGDCALTEWSYLGDGDVAISPEPSALRPLSIPATTTATIEVELQNVTQGRLRLVEPEQGTLSLTLTASVAEDGVPVAVPHELRWSGADARCAPADGPLRVINPGPSVWRLLGVTVEGDSGFELLRGAGRPLSLPAILPDGFVLELTGAFTARRAGLHRATANLRFESDRGVDWAQDVALEARSAQPPEPERRMWELAETAPVDLVLVIDAGLAAASLAENRTENLRQVMAALVGTEIDYRVAVTTADRTHGGGSFVVGEGARVAEPEERVFVDRQTTNPVETVLRWSQVGIGSGPSQPLDTSVELVFGPRAGELLREDAQLVVLYISPTRDRSARSPNAAVNELRALKGFRDPQLVRTHSVSGGHSGCSTMVGVAAETPRLAEMAARTGGVGLSICDDGWFTWLGPEVWATPPLMQYFIDSNPLPESLRVEVDGEPYPAVNEDGVPLWSFDPSLGVVLFTPEGQPPPGSRIEISFFPRCN